MYYYTLLVAWEGKREAEIQTSTVHNKAALPHSPSPHSFRLLFRPCTISFPFPSKQRERRGLSPEKEEGGTGDWPGLPPLRGHNIEKAPTKPAEDGEGKKGGGEDVEKGSFSQPSSSLLALHVAHSPEAETEEWGGRGGEWQQRECWGRTIRMRARLGLERGQGYGRSTVL